MYMCAYVYVYVYVYVCVYVYVYVYVHMCMYIQVLIRICMYHHSLSLSLLIRILRCSYIDESIRQSHFVDESPHEWMSLRRSAASRALTTSGMYVCM